MTASDAAIGARSLADLVASPEGRAFLADRGVFCSEADFGAELAPPAVEPIAPGMPVYTGHQLQVDYGHSVVAKLEALRDLTASSGITPVVVWLDTDRIGSQASMTTLSLDVDGEEVRARLVPYRLRDREARFAPVEAAALDAAFGVLARLDAAPERMEALRAAATGTGEPRTLAEVTLATSNHLLRGCLSLEAESFVVSSLLEHPAVRTAVDDGIAHVDDIVSVFNTTVDTLLAAGVDPLVKPLGDDWLPLHYSCPRDGARRRLAREHRGADLFGAASCRCGETYRFYLGDGIGELAATQRWSLDVTLPAYLDGLVSGVVAGRSSALYGLVLNEVVAKVFGRRPAPALVPAGLGAPALRPDGLLVRWLDAW